MVKKNTAFLLQFGKEITGTKDALEATVKGSLYDLVDAVTLVRPKGGNLPIDSGYLRATTVASTNGFSPIDYSSRPVKGQTYPDNADAVYGVIAGLQPGDNFYLSFTAAYALRMNYGFNGQDSLGRTYNQNGYLFVDNAVLEWDSIVAKNAKKAGL